MTRGQVLVQAQSAGSTVPWAVRFSSVDMAKDSNKQIGTDTCQISGNMMGICSA
jgi:hypothetical protein